MSTARSRVGVAVVNGLLYAIGGYDGQLRLSTVEVYNPETDTWTRVRSMNSKRRYSGSRLHVLGHSLGPHGLGRGRHPRSAESGTEPVGRRAGLAGLGGVEGEGKPSGSCS